LPIQKYYKRNVPSLDVVAVQDERRAHEHRDEEDPVVRAVRRDDGLDGTSKWRQEVLRGLNDGRKRRKGKMEDKPGQCPSVASMGEEIAPGK
jgi:hypothetical protein